MDRELVLQTALEARAIALGAAYFGVADLASVRDTVVAQGWDFAGRYRYGVSVGVALSHGLVAELHDHKNPDLTQTYRHHVTIVSALLDRMAATLAVELERAGHRAVPVPAGQPINDERMAGFVSHKLTAHLAGHGWIGKNCLLTTREHGPRVRWVTVLTDASLASTGGTLASGDECKGCTICVDLCPAGAFTGIPFDPAESVEMRFHRGECRKYLGQRGKTVGAPTCGLCVYVCPHGSAGARKADGQRARLDALRRQVADIKSAAARLH